MIRFRWYALALLHDWVGGSIDAQVPAGSQGERPRYVVTFSAVTPRIVGVEASFVLREPTLRMDPGPPAIAGGWPSFVRDVTLRDERGAIVPVERAGIGEWRAIQAVGQRVTLRYSLAITHDDTLPNGEPRWARDRTVTEIAFARPWGVYTTARVLFVFGDWMRDIDLTIRAPRGHAVASSWGIGRDSVVAVLGPQPGARAGLIVAGQLALSSIRIGTFTIHTALGGPLVGANHRRIDSIAVGAMRHFQRVFETIPPEVRGVPFTSTLLAIGDERNVMFVGGGLAGKDIAMLVPPDGPFSGDVTDAAIAHELFHLWNGASFRYRSLRESWFSEGFSEYYSVRVLREIGFIDDARYLARLREAERHYRADSGFAKISMHDAGDAKFRHRGLTYFGGQLVAACLDASLRSASGGRRSLDDVMRVVYGRYDTADNRFDSADILDVIASVGGADLGARARSWVMGTTAIPTTGCLTS